MSIVLKTGFKLSKAGYKNPKSFHDICKNGELHVFLCYRYP